MPVEQIVVGPLETNCYVVSDGNSPEAMIVDAGDDAGRIVRALTAAGLVPRVLFSTHGHVDHVAANAELKERFPQMELALLGDERETLLRPALNLSLFMGGSVRPPEPDRLLAEGDGIAFGSLSFRVVALPGHTPGGAAAFGHVDGAPAVFSGDALFADSIGRHDFPGGDLETLLAAIRGKLLALPDETRVFPGHGPATTIGRERRHNPFLAG